MSRYQQLVARLARCCEPEVACGRDERVQSLVRALGLLSLARPGGWTDIAYLLQNAEHALRQVERDQSGPDCGANLDFWRTYGLRQAVLAGAIRIEQGNTKAHRESLDRLEEALKQLGG
jgi:hypothetical protein